MNVKELAGSLRAGVEKGLSPSRPGARERKTADTKSLHRALDRVHEDVRDLRAKHKLGVIATARVLFELQKQLLAAGYAPDLVRKLILDLLLQLFTPKK